MNEKHDYPNYLLQEKVLDQKTGYCGTLSRFLKNFRKC